PGIQPGVPPAGRAVALDVPDEFRLRRLRGERREADHQGHSRRPDPPAPRRHDHIPPGALWFGLRFRRGSFDLHDPTISHHAPICFLRGRSPYTEKRTATGPAIAKESVDTV